MPTEEHDSWLSGLGVDLNKARGWVSNEIDAVKDDASKAVNWVEDEAKKGVDWVKTEANAAVDDVKKGVDDVKKEAGKAVNEIKKDAAALKQKALGDQSGKPVPRPMESDCKPEHGYVPGPKNHLLCATHGHVVDTDQKTIIADSVASYVKDGVAGAVSGAVKKVDDAAKKAADAAPSLAGDALDETGGATGGLGAKLPLKFPVKFPPGGDKVNLGYVYGWGVVSYSVTYELADTGDPNAVVTFQKNGLQYGVELQKSLSQGATLKGDTKISGTKGSIGAALEIPSSETVKTTIGFEFVDIDAKEAKVSFAELKWTTACKPVSGTTPILGLKIKYSAELSVEVDFEPNWKTLAEYALKKFSVSLAEDTALGVAAGGTGAAGAVAVGIAAGAGVVGGIVGGLALTTAVCAESASLKISVKMPRSSANKVRMRCTPMPNCTARPCAVSRVATRRAIPTPKKPCKSPCRKIPVPRTTRPFRRQSTQSRTTRTLPSALCFRLCARK